MSDTETVTVAYGGASLIGILLGLADLVGIAHSFVSHGVGTGVADLIIPPYGIYMGLEAFLGH